MLLPLSHEGSTVRRLPWVSLSIVAICVAVQLYAMYVEPELEAEVIEAQRELHAIEAQVLREHYYNELVARQLGKNDEALERIAGAGSEAQQKKAIIEAQRAPLERFRRGEATSPNDPRYTRYQALLTKLENIERQHPTMRFGYRPALDGVGSMLTSLFTHAGWLHLLGNMWFLYLVGCNLEDRWGRWQFASFYLAAGGIAAFGFAALHPSAEEPLVGASGAVAGAMGAFMACFARAKVKMLYVYVLMLMPRYGTFSAPAWILLGLWMLEQLVMSWIEIAAGSQVAYSAHAWGFMFGAAVAFSLRKSGIDDQLDEASELAAEQSQLAWAEHPEYLRALWMRDRSDFAGATAALTGLAAEEPAHVATRETLLEIGLKEKDERAIDLALPFLIDNYHRAQADAPLIEVFRALRAAQPDYGLTDQELLRVATAASRANELDLVLRVVTELMQQHPQSPLLPRAYWVAAEAQARFGALEQQRDTLARIVHRFPQHACATLAREQLARMQVCA
jgi:membrane associated rhomboid family serine protease